MPVGEFMVTFLLVFTGLETAVNSVFDYLSMAYFAVGLNVLLSYRCYANALLGEFMMTFSRSGCRNVDQWTQEGHLPGHVGLLGRTIGQHCSGSWWIHDVRSLKGTVHGACFRGFSSEHLSREKCRGTVLVCDLARHCCVHGEILLQWPVLLPEHTMNIYLYSFLADRVVRIGVHISRCRLSWFALFLFGRRPHLVT